MTLEDLCTHIVDCAHKTVPEVESHGYYAVGTPAMRGNVINYDEARSIDYDTFAAWTTKLRPEYGDLLLAREAPVGPVVPIPLEENVAPGQRTVLLRPNRSIVTSRFLYYYLTSPARQAELLIKASGSTVPHLNVADIRTFSTPGIPSLVEQRAISEILGAFDDKIVANDRVVDLSDKLAEAVLSAALDGRSSQLSRAALVTMGSSPPGISYNEIADGLPFYQGVRDFGIRFPKRRVWTTAPVRTASFGDTLVSVRAPVGRTNIANEDICIGRGVASLQSRSECPMTLFHQVRAAREAWAPYEAEGTIFGAINKSQLEAVLLPMVRPEMARQLEQALAMMENRIAAALSENETLATTRDQLLPLLMSGKLRVRAGEKVVEGVV